jgi:hypothetical protein
VPFITNAARGASNVEALVYLGAFIPDENESVATSYDPAAYPGALLDESALIVRPTYNAAAESQGGQDADLYIRAELFRTIFAGDQDRRTAAVMAAAQRPLSAYAFTEPSGAHVRTVRSAHDVMVSHPGAVVDLIEHVARRVH